MMISLLHLNINTQSINFRPNALAYSRSLFICERASTNKQNVKIVKTHTHKNVEREH